MILLTSEAFFITASNEFSFLFSVFIFSHCISFAACICDRLSYIRNISFLNRSSNLSRAHLFIIFSSHRLFAYLIFIGISATKCNNNKIQWTGFQFFIDTHIRSAARCVFFSLSFLCLPTFVQWHLTLSRRCKSKTQSSHQHFAHSKIALYQCRQIKVNNSFDAVFYFRLHDCDEHHWIRQRTLEPSNLLDQS